METPSAPAALPRASHESPARLARHAGMLALAASMLLCGLCSTAFFAVLPFIDKSSTRIETNTILGAAAGFGFFFAAILAWQGLQKESSSAAKIFPPVLALALAFLGAIFLGIGALSLKPIAPFAFPPFHFLAALLIPLVFVAYAARRLGKTSGLRALVAFFSWGAMGATALALVAELLTAALVILLAAIALSTTPDGRALLERSLAQLQLAPSGDNPFVVEQLLANPAVANGLLFYFALLIPPLEEALKTLALALVPRARTQLADAVLWGMSAGAGFALLENLFNAAGLLDFWAGGMFLRVGATTMHVANGALMGQGWYAARVERKWGRLGVAYGASVFFHALWNGTVILLSQRAAQFQTGAGIAFERLLAHGVFVLALGGVLGLLSILGLVWVVYAVRIAQQKLLVNSQGGEPAC